MIENKSHVETLIRKAAESDTAEAAMKFAQAAFNAANAMCAMGTAAALKGK